MVIIVAAVWLSKGRAHDASSGDGMPASSATKVGHRDAPGTKPIGWFGQRGIGDRKIAGVVLLDGVGVAGATVRLAGPLTMAGLAPELKVVTDAAGGFDFGMHLATSYFVLAEAPHLTGTMAAVDLRNPTQTPEQLKIMLHACDASLHGTIHDAGGGVVPKARVSREVGVRTGWGTEADDAGAYELCVPVGFSTVTVRAEGYARVTEDLSAFGTVRHDFALGLEATIGGQVVRASDHSAVADAVVELHDTTSSRVEYASTDAAGHFTFDGVTPGRHALTAKADQLATARPLFAVAAVGKSADQILELGPAVVISGKVVETGTKTGVAGITVTMRSLANMQQAITQADGSFVIDHAMPGDYEGFVVQHKLANPTKVKVGATDATDVVIEVDRLATISGRVTRQGKPIDGAEVWARSTQMRATTDSDGKFTLRNLAAGSFGVYAESKRIGAFATGPTIVVAAGEQRTGVDIELDLSGSVSGIVVDQNDVPVAGVYVRFSLLHGSDFGQATTSDDGTFSARSMAGGGDYLYEVRASDRAPVAYHAADGKRFPPVTVQDGNSHITGVRIKIQLDRLVIAGRVLDPAGQPVADVSVRAMPVGRTTGTLPTAMTDTAGAFTIRDLSEGAYLVTARGTDGDGREDNVAAGRNDVTVHLAGLGSIEGNWEAFTDPPEIVVVRADTGERNFAMPTISGTTFRLRDLPAGSYRVVAKSTTGFDLVTATVTAGAPTKVTLHQRGFGSVTGALTDDTTHAPVANAYCSATSANRELDRMVQAISSERTLPASTDTSGAYHIAHVVEGSTSVICTSDKAMADGVVTVAAGQTARLDLAARTLDHPQHRQGHAGLELEIQLGEVMVKTVEHGGAAERAGLVVGDTLQQIDGRALRSDTKYAVRLIEGHTEGTPAKLLIERANTQLTLSLTPDTAP